MQTPTLRLSPAFPGSSRFPTRILFVSAPSAFTHSLSPSPPCPARHPYPRSHDARHTPHTSSSIAPQPSNRGLITARRSAEPESVSARALRRAARVMRWRVLGCKCRRWRVTPQSVPSIQASSFGGSMSLQNEVRRVSMSVLFQILSPRPHRIDPTDRLTTAHPYLYPKSIYFHMQTRSACPHALILCAHHRSAQACLALLYSSASCFSVHSALCWRLLSSLSPSASRRSRSHHRLPCTAQLSDANHSLPRRYLP